MITHPNTNRITMAKPAADNLNALDPFRKQRSKLFGIMGTNTEQQRIRRPNRSAKLNTEKDCNA
jgi:hypothetical protein